MGNLCLVVKSIHAILRSRSGRSWREIFEQGNLEGERQRDLACSSIIELRTATACAFFPQQIAPYGPDFRILGKNHILPI
jgi:hypothetical protein